MALFDFKITFASKISELKGFEIQSKIEAEDPNDMGELEINSDQDNLEAILSYIRGKIEDDEMESKTITGTFYGEELFTQGEEITPLEYYSIMKIYQEEGFLKLEVLRNEDWLEQSTVYDGLPEGAYL